jgi:phage terminase large subunit
MELNIKHTGVFTKNYDALNDKSKRFIINQGGSRSSKTYSLCQLIIVYCLQNKKKKVSIVRKTFPALSATIMKDFFEVLDELGIYDNKYHNKSNSVYKFPNGSYVEFFSVDDSQKLRGRKRDLCVLNEANELSSEEFMQINMRTTEKIFADYNPSETEHFLYDLVERSDAIMIHSTYKDNPFLEDAIVHEIEELIKVDQDYFNIYALGLPAKNNHTVFNHQIIIDKLPPIDECTITLGLDFGFVHPTSLIMTLWQDEKCFTKELLYESSLTSAELVIRMETIFKNENIPMSTTIACDYARPEIIEDLVRRGFNAVNAIKNVKDGIDAVKSTQLFVEKDSYNMLKEFRNYKWKLVREKLTDEVVKAHDDAMDAMRYAILYHKRNTVSAGSWSFDTF